MKFRHVEDGVVTTVEIDETNDRLIFDHWQDPQPTLDHVAERDNDGTGGWSKSRDFKYLGSVPAALEAEWLNEAYVKKIPIWNKEIRDAFIMRKLEEHNRLKIKSKGQFRVGP